MLHAWMIKLNCINVIVSLCLGMIGMLMIDFVCHFIYPKIVLVCVRK